MSASCAQNCLRNVNVWLGVGSDLNIVCANTCSLIMGRSTMSVYALSCRARASSDVTARRTAHCANAA